MTAIELSDIGFCYPGSSRWVFRDLDFSLAAGEVVQIVGRNGTGKSTLLKLLSGLLQPTEGSLVLPPGGQVAYMDQSAGDMLAHGLTILEQLKVSSRKDTIRIDSLVEMLQSFGLDLHSRLNVFVGHLSGGQRQVVALLCTLASGASVLCLDEFTSSLDSESSKTAQALLEYAALERNVALAIVSHSEKWVTSGSEFEMRSDYKQPDASSSPIFGGHSSLKPRPKISFSLAKDSRDCKGG